MYAVCCALGVIAAAILLISRVKKYGVPPIHAIQVCIFASIGTVIGSKLLFLLTQFDTIIPEFSFGLLIGRFINSGFVFYGGLFTVMGRFILLVVANHTVYQAYQISLLLLKAANIKQLAKSE